MLNAENGDEATIAIKPGEGDKKIAVVGGGIAGLEAARVAAKRGYDVTVYEASDHLAARLCWRPRLRARTRSCARSSTTRRFCLAWA